MGRRKRERKKRKADKKENLETMAEMAGAINAYRPHQQEAQNAALQQVLSFMQPSQDMMAQYYGTPGIDSSMYGNIIGPDMMGVGATSKAPGFPAPPGQRDGSAGPGQPAQTNDRGQAINQPGQIPGQTHRTFY